MGNYRSGLDTPACGIENKLLTVHNKCRLELGSVPCIRGDLRFGADNVHTVVVSYFRPLVVAAAGSTNAFTVGDGQTVNGTAVAHTAVVLKAVGSHDQQRVVIVCDMVGKLTAFAQSGGVSHRYHGRVFDYRKHAAIGVGLYSQDQYAVFSVHSHDAVTLGGDHIRTVGLHGCFVDPDAHPAVFKLIGMVKVVINNAFLIQLVKQSEKLGGVFRHHKLRSCADVHFYLRYAYLKSGV